MTIHLNTDQTQYLRHRAQYLYPRAQSSSAQLVRSMVGIQAQEPAAAVLAVRVRTRDQVAPQIDRAREHDRSLVRTWGMRGTLHLLAAQDLGWLLSLLGPVSIRKSQRRFSELGLNEEIFTRARRAIQCLLEEGGPMSRAELIAGLTERGIPTEGQAAYHLVRRAGLEGLLCYGPDLGGESTFVLLDDWVETGAAMDPDRALTRLARRYLAAYGPARPEDLAAWSGLPLTSVRTGFSGLSEDLTEVMLTGERAWLPKTHIPWLDDRLPESAIVRLLPGYDPYLLGYRDRDWFVDQDFAKGIHPGGGVIRPTLLVNGRAAGTWKLQRRAGALFVHTQLFEGLSAAAISALEAEVRDLGRFLERRAFLHEVFPVD